MDKAKIAQGLDKLFDAERQVRKLHDELSDSPREALVDAVAAAVTAALRESREDEATLRLVRCALLLGELDGPRVVDTLVDILGADVPEARLAAGEELEQLAFDRFKEVAQGVERAIKRLPLGSPALAELPYILSEVPEPGVDKLLERFLGHEDAEAVAAAIEIVAERGDPSLVSALRALVKDERRVELDDDRAEAPEQVTLGELAQEALDLLEGPEEG